MAKCALCDLMHHQVTCIKWSNWPGVTWHVLTSVMTLSQLVKCCSWCPIIEQSDWLDTGNTMLTTLQLKSVLLQHHPNAQNTTQVLHQRHIVNQAYSSICTDHLVHQTVAVVHRATIPTDQRQHDTEYLSLLVHQHNSKPGRSSGWRNRRKWRCL